MIEVYEYTIKGGIRKSIEPFLCENETEAKKHIKKMFKVKCSVEEIDLTYATTTPDEEGSIDLIKRGNAKQFSNEYLKFLDHEYNIPELQDEIRRRQDNAV